MFKKIIYGIWCAVAAVTCMCEEVKGMKTLSDYYNSPTSIYKQMGIRLDYYNDPVYREYVRDFSTWKKDGERFLMDSFIRKYKNKNVLPILNDGRPELLKWINYTNVSSVFWADGWNWGTRYNLAKPFIENMLELYTINKMSEEYVQGLRLILLALEQTKEDD